MCDYKLIKPFEESLLFSDYEDVITDYAELPLDRLATWIFGDIPSALSDIPIIKGVVAVGKVGWSVKKALFLRNQLTFLQSLRKGTPNPEALNKRRVAMTKGEKWIYKEVETSMIYLERYTNSEKAKCQAKLYGDLINEIITYDVYEECLAILDQVFLQDVQYFLDITDYSFRNDINVLTEKELRSSISSGYRSEHLRRLEYFGLITGFITTSLGTSVVDKYTISIQGVYLYTVFQTLSNGNHIFMRVKKPEDPLSSFTDRIDLIIPPESNNHNNNTK